MKIAFLAFLGIISSASLSAAIIASIIVVTQDDFRDHATLHPEAGSQGVADKVPVRISLEKRSDYPAILYNYSTEPGGDVLLRVNLETPLMPPDVFDAYELHVMDRPIAAIKNQYDFLDPKLLHRKERSREKAAEFLIHKAELKQACILVSLWSGEDSNEMAIERNYCVPVPAMVAYAGNGPFIFPDYALKKLQGVVPETTPIDAEKLKAPGELLKIFPGQFEEDGIMGSSGSLYLFADQSYVEVLSHLGGLQPAMPYSVGEGRWSFADGIVTLSSAETENKDDEKFLLMHQTLDGKEQVLLVGLPDSVRWIVAQSPYNPESTSRQRMLTMFSYKRKNSLSPQEMPRLKAELLALRTRTWDETMIRKDPAEKR